MRFGSPKGDLEEALVGISGAWETPERLRLEGREPVAMFENAETVLQGGLCTRTRILRLLRPNRRRLMILACNLTGDQGQPFLVDVPAFIQAYVEVRSDRPWGMQGPTD